jgi:hypothetical protein
VPTPDFLATVVAVKKQMENFGGQIDIAMRSGYIDCRTSVDSYDYVSARATQTVPDSMAGAYQLYTSGVSIFVNGGRDLYQNCANYLANPDVPGSIPHSQWSVARTAVNDASEKLRQAIIALGGTP